ncbi:hypothetical protein BA939_23740 [Rhizobium sp. S41]|nr:hypothetical protein BA939_23740 [Rhizobium sp. S41]KGE80388.1 hypothetical protein LW14_23190 [Rhizobium sp. H41]
MDRRTVLKGGLVLAATAHTTANVAVAGDPLVQAVKNFEQGKKAFCSIKEADWPSLGGEDAVIEMTYGAPMRVLDEWNKPCTSLEGAISALRHAVDEADVFSCSESLDSMLRAALGYLESLPA